MTTFLTLALVPFYVLIVLVLIGIPVTALIKRLPQEHWLRKLLLKKIS